MEDIKAAIRDVPDFPKPGIVFKDITPILADPELFSKTVQRMAEPWKDANVDSIIAVESRGFIFGAAMVPLLNAGLVPIRKAGKLPCETVSETYSLEYGEDTLEMHKDGLAQGGNVLIVDDLLATGGSAKATANLVEKAGANIVGFSFLIELAFLEGRKKLEGYRIESLIKVSGEE